MEIVIFLHKKEEKRVLNQHRDDESLEIHPQQEGADGGKYYFSILNQSGSDSESGDSG